MEDCSALGETVVPQLLLDGEAEAEPEPEPEPEASETPNGPAATPTNSEGAIR
jgi:hypothetical protein